MLTKARAWHSGLSKLTKVFLWTVTAVTFGVAIANANPGATTPQSTPTPKVQVESTEVEKSLSTKQTKSETEKIPFDNTSVIDANLTSGTSEIRIAGVDGVKTKTYEIELEDGVEISRNLINEEITVAPVTQVTALGTKVIQKKIVSPPPPATSSSCDPNYSGFCVPLVSYDLDCPDIGHRVTVIGSDPHGFDGSDNDGFGCESY